MNSSRQIALLAAVLFLTWIATGVAEEKLVSRIRREPVASSNVASIGYSRHLRALEIEFVRGAVYRFLGVPRSVYRELMAANSKGHFIAEHIRGQYDFQRVRPSGAKQSRRSRPILANESD